MWGYYVGRLGEARCAIHPDVEDLIVVLAHNGAVGYDNKRFKRISAKHEKYVGVGWLLVPREIEVVETEVGGGSLATMHLSDGSVVRFIGSGVYVDHIEAPDGWRKSPEEIRGAIFTNT